MCCLKFGFQGKLVPSMKRYLQCFIHRTMSQKTKSLGYGPKKVLKVEALIMISPEKTVSRLLLVTEIRCNILTVPYKFEVRLSPIECVNIYELHRYNICDDILKIGIFQKKIRNTPLLGLPMENSRGKMQNL